MQISVRGHTFTLPDLWAEGHAATPIEAQAINRAVEKNTRAAINAGAITTRADAIAFSQSDEALFGQRSTNPSFEDLM